MTQQRHGGESRETSGHHVGGPPLEPTRQGDPIDHGGDPEAIAADLGFEAMDTGELESLVDSLIADNPDEWGRFVEGDKKIQGFFVGQIMKATKGQADGKVVNQLLSRKASS